ncbi:hypothetical protein HanRHA438_Chr13g0603651 [Helianthus annuus]|uniref:Uncharacterized protein n=1 Tax=Helianthus annuus TaxID=4232 RepID=A0A251STI7_HELAN|nr:hypothetical protein HanXRQr2_Chr13g0593011 [Helianthus annuus]KAJ0498095.1 hypothetical protein HanHA89_Chr13g0518531 [Helianthus annuus]KAJ0849629.1 hypothetical protein HanPSC8_Chr13g0571001 [Helianthus annuus]KAJ0858671.1 hypothetical protein HanRHA438_Chr13g0603651 [Helianthus annuus]
MKPPARSRWLRPPITHPLFQSQLLRPTHLKHPPPVIGIRRLNERERIDQDATRIRRDEREAGARERNSGVQFLVMIRHWRRSRSGGGGGFGSDKLPIGFRLRLAQTW